MKKELSMGNRNIVLDRFNSKKEKSITVDCVVDINLFLNSDEVFIREECDQYYAWNLTKEELIQFIKLIDSHFELKLF